MPTCVSLCYWAVRPHRFFHAPLVGDCLEPGSSKLSEAWLGGGSVSHFLPILSMVHPPPTIPSSF